MKNSSALVLGVLALLAAGCAPPPQVDIEAEKAALVEADKAMSDAVPDVDAILSFVTDDSVMMPGAAPTISGREALRAGWTELVSAPGFALSWTPTEAVVARSGEVGYTVGTFDWRYNNEEGAAVVTIGKYVAIWEKQANGEWKLAVDIWNADGPPAPASEETE